MFRDILKAFKKENFIVTAENGKYMVKDKDSGKIYFSMPANIKREEKELKLINCYNNLIAGKMAK